MKRSKCSKCILGRGSRKKKKRGDRKCKGPEAGVPNLQKKQERARENTSMSEGQGLPLSPLR